MNIVWFVVFWILGLVYFSFSLSQILMMVFCGFPVTRTLHRIGAITDYLIVSKNKITVAIHTIIGIAIIVPLLVWGKWSMIVGFFIGCLIGLISSRGKLGMSPDNISDFISSRRAYLDLDKLNELNEFVDDIE